MNGSSSTATAAITIYNPPGLPVIRYRVGDFASFRAALLTPLPGETELVDWRPTAVGDLGVQLLEWWAYLADILTFYNEQIANQSYLDTTSLTTNLLQLTNLLGYSPDPATAATGEVAAVASATTSVTVPSGFALQSTPDPGSTPQVFETTGPTTITFSPSGGSVVVDATQATPLKKQTYLLFDAPVSGVSVGDFVVLAPTTSVTDPKTRLKEVKKFLEKPDDGLKAPAAQALRVTKMATKKDPLGRPRYCVTFSDSIAASGLVTDLSLLRKSQFAIPSALLADTRLAAEARMMDRKPEDGRLAVVLAAPLRTVRVGDLVVVEEGSGALIPLTVVAYEEFWYPPPPTEEELRRDRAVRPSILHGWLSLAGGLDDDTKARLVVERIWYGFATISANTVGESPTTIGTDVNPIAVKPLSQVPPGLGHVAAGQNQAPSVLVEDANQLGTSATPSLDEHGNVILKFPTGTKLQAPIKILSNILSVSQGRTVTSEILGSGDASVGGQIFTLQKGPLTYLPGKPLGSTLTVTVGASATASGTQWKEVSNFYGQGPEATVFVVSHDANQGTTLRFGDGVHGARLLTGRGNVTATYRYGSAGTAIAPLTPPGQTKLVTMLTPQPGVASIRSPIAMQAGQPTASDKDIRTGGPASVKHLGRAVTAADYESIAHGAGARWARATVHWDRHRRRAAPIIYVDQSAVVSAVQSSVAAASPHSGVCVKAGRAVTVRIEIKLLVFPGYDPQSVGSKVKSQLVADGGPLSASPAPLNRPPAAGRIRAACHDVDGVVAASVEVSEGPFAREPDAFFVVTPERIHVHAEVDRNG